MKNVREYFYCSFLLKNGWDDWSKSDDRVQLETKWCKISKVSNWSRTGTWLVGASAHNGPYVEVSDRESPVSHRWKLSSIKRLPLDCMAQSLGSVRWPSYTRQISSFFIFCHIKATPKKSPRDRSNLPTAATAPDDVFIVGPAFNSKLLFFIKKTIINIFVQKFLIVDK